MAYIKRITIKPRKTISYKYYICSCGRKIIPVTNPSICPYCHKATILRS